MKLFFKVIRYACGLFFFFLYKRTLNIQELLKGKRVAIVGAANSAFHTDKGNYIDGFDIVIRINKAPLLLQDGKWRNDIGAKTDILFHSFFENLQSGGGPLDFELFDKLGISYTINPVASFEGYRATFNFYKKYLKRRITYSINRNWYKTMKKNLGGYRPTIGSCALFTCLECDFSELYITGFTFFKTPFGEGYRDTMKEAHQVQQYIKEAGLHNPDLEFSLFLNLLIIHSKKNIILDDTLSSIVADYPL